MGGYRAARRASFTRQKWVATTRRSVTHARKLATLLTSLALATALPAWAQDDARVLEVPGLDFSRLPAPAKKELATVFTDEFDYCGRPMTLAASLKKGDACRHTRRLVSYAAAQAAEGLPATEIINALARYNLSFNGKRAALKPDDRLCKGPADAKLVVVEYSDFECPYCNAARPMLEDLVKRRKDTKVCWQPFPLSGHANAVPASQAALFARDAGKFWAMHDALFDNQLSLSEALIKQLAGKLGLDVAALTKAMAAGKYVDELNASKDTGKAAGVDATPSFYVNGRKLTLNPSAEALQVALDDEADWLAGKGSWLAN